MSSLQLADTLVGRARRRLAARHAFDAAATGALIAGGVAVALGLVATAGALAPLPAALLLGLPGLGAVVGASFGFAARPGRTASALAVDRAAGAQEAFVSALTAVDAAPAMREVSARYGLSVVGERSLGTLLPLAVPDRAAPAAVAIALTLVLVALGASEGARQRGAGGRDSGGVAPGRAGPALVATAGTGPSGGTEGGIGQAPAAGVTAPDPGTGLRPDEPAAAEADVREGDLPELSEAEVRSLAEDLAARGVEGAVAALEALAGGDRVAAEEALRSALVARGDGSGWEDSPLPAAGSTSRPVGTAPGGWSAGTWPLRYDREVRAWLRRQVAIDGRANPKGDER